MVLIGTFLKVGCQEPEAYSSIRNLRKLSSADVLGRGLREYIISVHLIFQKSWTQPTPSTPDPGPQISGSFRMWLMLLALGSSYRGCICKVVGLRFLGFIASRVRIG